MHTPRLDLLHHVPQIDPETAGIELNRKLFGLQPGIARLGEVAAQLAQGLAQRCARLFLLGLAPKQADEALARLLARIVEGDIGQNRKRLAALDSDVLALE